MNVTSKISVDLTRPNMGTWVNAVQGDGNTRIVEVSLLSGGEAWEPPADAEAAIAYYQLGGVKGLYNLLADGTAAISISGNVATIVLAPQMLTASGTVQASLVFNDPSLNRLTTFPFFVSVAINPSAGAQQNEDYIRLQWLENKLDEYLRKAADSGAFDGKPGDNGVTFTPNVSENGDISWRNNGGLPNPQTVNIRGPQGDSTAATAAANAAQTSAANAETHAADAATSAAAAQAAADAMETELGHIKDDLTGLQTVVDSKADKTDLAKTNLYLDALYKLNKGQTYDVLEQESEAYSVDVPSGAKYVGIDKVGGKSIVWNQLANDFELYGNSGQLTRSGNKYTYTFTTLSVNQYENSIRSTERFNSVSGHKYLEFFDVFCTKAFTVSIGTVIDSWAYKNVTANVKERKGVIIDGNGATPFLYIGASIRNHANTFVVGDTFEISNIQLIDLTQMFGSTIADYIYSLEQATTGAGVAWFNKLFPDDYYPYSEPTIISSQTDRVEMASADSTVTQQITTGFPVLNSAGSVYDYIDIDNGELHRRVGSVYLGTLNWRISFIGEANRFDSTAVADIVKTDTWAANSKNLLSSNGYEASGIPIAGNTKNMCIGTYHGCLYVRDDSYTDATAFKTAMSGVMLYYELSKEIITDITIPTELTDWLTVEAGGSITFNNADDGKRLLIPNKLSFVRKLDEVTV